jgi:carbamoyl-phosphate synthase small subunit
VRDALLLLEDGTAFRGTGFGAEGEAFGEAVFNTGMSGYQEVLTDPSYSGQVVAMTAPQQGNYGTAPNRAACTSPGSS